jgi:hypothetical protein
MYFVLYCICVHYTDTGAVPCEFSFCADSGARTCAVAVSGAGVGSGAGALAYSLDNFTVCTCTVLTLTIKKLNRSWLSSKHVTIHSNPHCNPFRLNLSVLSPYILTSTSAPFRPTISILALIETKRITVHSNPF